MKNILLVIFISITSIGYSQQQRPVNLNMTISDTMFVTGLVPRIEKSIKLIQESSIATKESLPVIQGLNEVIQYMNGLITSQLPASSSTIDGGNVVERPKPKKNK